MYGLLNPSGMICALWKVQAGLCFHCNKPMILLYEFGSPKSQYATREHVYPRSGNGKALLNNIVLAHAGCNHSRGDAEPTAEEITKAKAIYVCMGLTAFLPRSAWDRNGPAAKIFTEERMRFLEENYEPPTMRDVWPEQ